MRLAGAALTAVALAAAALVLEEAPVPWAWLAGLGAVACAVVVVRARRGGLRLLALHAGVVLGALGAAEAWHARGDRERFSGYDPAEFYLDDDRLGYVLAPGSHVRARRAVGGETVYDASYTTDAHGLRAAPPARPDARECVLFFGGSFTFGEGVDDAASLPWRTGVLAGGRYRVVNLGVPGYGPHQMLAALEDGLVERILDCTPRFAIYQGIWFHAFRAAGRETWDDDGPRFVLGADGDVERRGQFDDDAWLRLRRAVVERLRRSSLYRRVTEPRRRPSEADKRLFVAVVDAARRAVEARHPGCAFHVLWWDEPWVPLDDRLAARGLRLHRVSRILPDWREDPGRYVLHPRDNHPNALAHDLLARYVVRAILGLEPAEESAARRVRRGPGPAPEGPPAASGGA